MIGLSLAITASERPGRWAAPVMAACTQLRLASVLVGDLRRPWHKRPEPGQVLSPYRVRLGFRRLRAQLGTPAGTAKSTRPGPGRLRGRRTGPRPGRRSTAKRQQAQHVQQGDQARSLNYKLVRNGIGRKGDTAPQADPTRNA